MKVSILREKAAKQFYLKEVSLRGIKSSRSIKEQIATKSKRMKGSLSYNSFHSLQKLEEQHI